MINAAEMIPHASQPISIPLQRQPKSSQNPSRQHRRTKLPRVPQRNSSTSRTSTRRLRRRIRRRRPGRLTLCGSRSSLRRRTGRRPDELGRRLVAARHIFAFFLGENVVGVRRDALIEPFAALLRGKRLLVVGHVGFCAVGTYASVVEGILTTLASCPDVFR